MLLVATSVVVILHGVHVVNVTLTVAMFLTELACAVKTLTFSKTLIRYNHERTQGCC